MMKKFFFVMILVVGLALQTIFTANLVIPNKVAKIGDEIILKSDVEKYARINRIEFDNAKQQLINNALLNNGAKMYTAEPTEEEIRKYIQNEKFYYATLVGKQVKEIDDAEFIQNLYYNNISMHTYKSEIKKKIWRNKYLESIFKSAETNSYSPTDEEVNNLINTQPEIFEEKEGASLSMIYFSFYDENSILKTAEDINAQKIQAKSCLDELEKNKNFELAAMEYSDDLISARNNPKGYVGMISFDDPRIQSSFSAEIIKDLRNAGTGLVNNIFQTKNGLYIFKINEKINPEKLTGEARIIKAKDYLEKEADRQQKEKLYAETLRDLKAKVMITIY